MTAEVQARSTPTPSTGWSARTPAKVQRQGRRRGQGVRRGHADADRVDVLLYVNQTTTSTANGGEPQLALNRVDAVHGRGRRHLAGRRHHVVLTRRGRRPGERGARPQACRRDA